jgi:hypothetical protein
VFRECYSNDLRTTTCSGVLGHNRGSIGSETDDFAVLAYMSIAHDSMNFYLVNQIFLVPKLGAKQPK